MDSLRCKLIETLDRYSNRFEILNENGNLTLVEVGGLRRSSVGFVGWSHSVGLRQIGFSCASLTVDDYFGGKP
jgi:hypothetical protein